MIGYVMVGTNNLDAAIKFYDEVLGVIGIGLGGYVRGMSRVCQGR